MHNLGGAPAGGTSRPNPGNCDHYARQVATRSRRGLSTFSVLAITALIAATLGLVAFVPSADAAPSITVRVGYGGRHRPGTDMLVQVEEIGVVASPGSAGAKRTRVPVDD